MIMLMMVRNSKHVSVKQMCMSELLESLRIRGATISEAQIRYAIKSGKLKRPPLDGSLSYRFSDEDLQSLLDLFDRAPI